MYRILLWPLIFLNIAVICSFILSSGLLGIYTTINSEAQVTIYLIWLLMNVVVFFSLFAKAYSVGEGVTSLLIVSFYGSLALIVITIFCMILTDVSIVKLFTIPYGFLLGITTFSQVMMNMFCFDKPKTA